MTHVGDAHTDYDRQAGDDHNAGDDRHAGDDRYAGEDLYVIDDCHAGNDRHAGARFYCWCWSMYDRFTFNYSYGDICFWQNNDKLFHKNWQDLI